jgi:hypothetical protein
MREFPTLATVVLLAAAAIAPATQAANKPCPPSGSNSPISDQNVVALGDVSHVVSAIQEVPTDKKERKLYKITVSAQYSTGAPQTVFVDLTQESFNHIVNESAPGYRQALADLNAATILFLHATDQVPCPKGVTVCGPQTLAQYESYLQSQSANLSPNAKALFASMLGNQLSALYRDTTEITPLSTVFQALITNAKNAGECRDIATFIAVSMKAMGLKNAGVIGADWNNGTVTGSHVAAQYQDPATGHYVFVNYGDVFDTGDTLLSEAAQKAALNLNPYTSSVMVQSVNSSGGGSLHEEISPRTQQIQHNIEQASDPNNPTYQAAVGNLESSASAHTQLAGSDKNSFGVFGMGAYNRQGDAYQSAAAGARGDFGTQFSTGANTAVTLKGSTIDGALVVTDQLPSGDTNYNTRSDVLFFTNTKAEADWGWNESPSSPGNSGHIGLQAAGQDAIYSHFTTANTPYDTFTLSAVDNPTKSIQLHVSNTGFFAQTTEQDIHPGYHQVEQTAGVKVTNSYGDGRLAFSNDTTLHNFQKGAMGATNSTQLRLHSEDWGDFVASGEIGYVHNTSGDAFYNYPLTCKISMAYEKKWGKAVIDAGGEYNCNQHNAFSLFNQDDSDGLITPPKEKYGIVVHF